MLFFSVRLQKVLAIAEAINSFKNCQVTRRTEMSPGALRTARGTGEIQHLYTGALALDEARKCREETSVTEDRL